MANNVLFDCFFIISLLISASASGHDSDDTRARVLEEFIENTLRIDARTGTCGTDVHRFVAHLLSKGFAADNIRIYEVDKNNQALKFRDAADKSRFTFHYFFTYREGDIEYVFDYLTNAQGASLATWLKAQLGGYFVTDSTYRFARWTVAEYDLHFRNEFSHHELLTFSQLAPDYFSGISCNLL